MPQMKRVRIALAINEFGQWAAWGRWDMRDESNMNEANGNVGREGPQACYFLEVDVPVPDYPTLAASLDGDGKVIDYRSSQT